MGKSNVKSIIKRNSRLNEVAFRTLVASIVCLVVSFANIFSLQMLHGRERGLVCLTCCTVDVTINVITIHWVTTYTPFHSLINVIILSFKVTSQTGSRAKDSQLDISISQLDSSPDQLLVVAVNNDATPIQHNNACSSLKRHSAKDDHTDSMFSFIEESQSSRKSLAHN